jgi:hypothetical protein
MKRNILLYTLQLGLILMAFPALAPALPDGAPATLEAPQY